MANCETCKSKEAKTPENIPWMAHEFAMVRMERQVKRLWIALLVCISMIFASNVAWFYAWMQYDYVSETYTEEVIVDSKDGGNANYIGNDGDIVNGNNPSDKNNQTEEEN